MLAVLVLAPTVASLPTGGEPAPPCAQTLEARVAQARTHAYTADTGAGAWRTWRVGPDDVDVPPPPGALSARAIEERAELHRMALERTPAQTATARWWDEGPASWRWETIALDLVVEHGATDPRVNPPRVARMLAILETATFDALVIAWDAKYCHQRAPPATQSPAIQPVVRDRGAPAYPSEHAVVAGVASFVLAHFFPSETTTLHAQAEAAAESRLWAGANHRSDVEAGLALGRQVARHALEARADDGSDAAWSGAAPDGACHWSPTPPDHAPPLEPQWGRVRPFLMSAPSQLRPGPPPACDGEEYLRQTRALWEASRNVTAAQEAIAWKWAGGPGTETPPGMAFHVALNESRERDLSTMRHARMTSHVAAALADAGIAAWDAKFHHWSGRPIHGIQRHFDPDWQPLVDTPPFPGYVSGHATFSGAAAAALAHHFPDETAVFDAQAQEAAQSRFWGGIHIDADNARGLEVGRAVGALAAAREATVG